MTDSNEEPVEDDMHEQQTVDEQGVRLLARAAGLPLDDERLPAVAELLGTWLGAANELSRTMSAPEHLAVMPATVFTHPVPDPTD
jgi:hypothetical protein